MLNEIIIGLGIGIVFFIIIAMLIIMKLKRFETEGSKNVLNLVFIGMIFYMITVIVELLNYIDIFGGNYIGNYIDLSLMNDISMFAAAPLILICFMAAVFVLREHK